MLTSTATTVIGVMPPGFRFPLYRVDLWVPLVPTAGMLSPSLHDRQRRNFMLAFGRLADRVTLPQARAEMEGIGHRLEQDYPLTNRNVVPSVKSFQEFWIGPNDGVAGKLPLDEIGRLHYGKNFAEHLAVGFVLAGPDGVIGIARLPNERIGEVTAVDRVVVRDFLCG